MDNNPYNNQLPPKYDDVINAQIMPNPAIHTQYIAGGMGQVTQQTYAVPAYPGVHQSNVTIQPIATAPPMMTYGTMPTYPIQQAPVAGQVTTTQYITQAPTEIIVVGGCPACRIGVLTDDFTCCGVCCAIVFFPVGILCCLCMKEKRCTHCGASF